MRCRNTEKKKQEKKVKMKGSRYKIKLAREF